MGDSDASYHYHHFWDKNTMWEKLREEREHNKDLAQMKRASANKVKDVFLS